MLVFFIDNQGFAGVFENRKIFRGDKRGTKTQKKPTFQ
jgi:hypothetical protein